MMKLNGQVEIRSNKCNCYKIYNNFYMFKSLISTIESHQVLLHKYMIDPVIELKNALCFISCYMLLHYIVSMIKQLIAAWKTTLPQCYN